jgi:hypothetical protein
MIFTAAQLEHYIEVLRDLDKEDLADTLSAYVGVVRRIAEQGEAGSAELGDRVPQGTVVEARRLTGIGAQASRVG